MIVGQDGPILGEASPGLCLLAVSVFIKIRRQIVLCLIIFGILYLDLVKLGQAPRMIAHHTNIEGVFGVWGLLIINGNLMWITAQIGLYFDILHTG